MFKHFSLSHLPDNFFEQVEVGTEGFASGGGEGVGSDGAGTFHVLGHGDVAGLVERAEVRGHIAVGHFERIADVGEGELRRGGQQRHGGEPPLLVDDAVKLEKRFRVHGRLGSVK